MSDNIWQRLADKLRPNSRNTSSIYIIVDTLDRLAAEDAEREGQHECPTDIGVTANCPRCGADGAHKICVDRDGKMPSSAPPAGLPPRYLPCGCQDTARTMCTMVRGGRYGHGHYAQDGDFMGPCEKVSSDARSRAVDYNDPAGAVGEHRSFQQTSPECARASESSESRRAGWESASRNAATPDEGAGSSAPAAGTLPALDPALVEECLQLFYKHGGGVSSHAGGVSMDAALTHYRERVEGPLRELAEQRREALEYERGETRRAADASAFYQREADRLRGELADMEKRKDGAYEERNRVVALLAALYPSKRCRTAIEGWSDDWHGCVYIETPEGQLSWHYHDSQASMFAHVPEGAARWDGHTTEEKYRRVDRLCVNAAPAQRFTQPTDEERQRLANQIRQGNWFCTADRERIATLLEQPAPAPARKSIGRRWVAVRDGNVIDTCTDRSGLQTFYGKDATLIECDLVPVGEEKP